MPPSWPAELMQELAKYVFRTGSSFLFIIFQVFNTSRLSQWGLGGDAGGFLTQPSTSHQFTNISLLQSQDVINVFVMLLVTKLPIHYLQTHSCKISTTMGSKRIHQGRRGGGGAVTLKYFVECQPLMVSYSPFFQITIYKQAIMFRGTFRWIARTRDLKRPTTPT